MNLTLEAYKQAEANKPQSDLLKEWYVKISFSDNKSPPEELIRILEENQKVGSKANIVKLKLEFNLWYIVEIYDVKRAQKRFN